MTTRSQRDKEKKQQEEFQSILRRLLLEEDNKYCADCDAKGPRWASWNIGVFLCIRCAGIHRNLGVHISKVKSVNLDTWTEKQIASIEGLGNRICRKVYEANLPSSFRRPQTDSALEHFIRAKYEHKKYIDKELEKQLQAKKDLPRSSNISEPEKKKKSSQDKPVTLQKLAKAPASSSGTKQSPTKTQLAPINANAFQQQQPSRPTATSSAPVTPPKTQSSMDDLLGLSTPKIPDNNALFDIPISQQKADPLFAATPQMVPSSSAPSLSSPTQQQQPQQPPQQQPQQPVTNGVANDVDLFGTESTNTTSGKTSKESILALFGNQPSQQQQMYNIPGGLYIPSQQPNQAQMGNNFAQPQMMMNQQQSMMGMPAMQQGMMGANMGYGGVNNMQQQQAYLQQFQTEQVQNSPGFSQPHDASKQLSPISDMQSQMPTNNMHMQQPYMHMQQPADTNMLWQQSLGMNMQQPQNMYMTQQHGVASPTSSMNMPQYTNQHGGAPTQFMHMQQPDMTQVQAQMQNMRVSGNMGMNGQVGMNGQMAMNGQVPQQQQPAQAWNGGMYPNMQQAPGVPVQGNMGWGAGNMAGQTLSTQLWK